ncbi:hypothetical protein MVEN_01127800 [Mycena venus]|uniref:Uncharacterized protein n=1 Tax=Mycena venus TaxID=2733690 RepID=A0A8H6Y566_9AGAR|nr:hypothetical protein MVEN_01127800 [Mycena venus]
MPRTPTLAGDTSLAPRTAIPSIVPTQNILPLHCLYLSMYGLLKELLEARIPLAQLACIPSAGGTGVRDSGGVGEGAGHGGNGCGQNAGIGGRIDGRTTLLVDLGSCVHNEGIIQRRRSRVAWTGAFGTSSLS